MEFRKKIFLFALLLFSLLSTLTFNPISKHIHSQQKTIKIVSEEHKFNQDIYKLQLPKKANILTLEVTTLDKDHVNIQINDESPSRFKLPEEEPFPFTKKNSVGSLTHANFKIVVTEDPFSLSIVKHDSEVIFKLDTENFAFAFDENYLDFTVSLPSKYLYGLGERIMDFKFAPGIYTIYNKDQYDVEEDGTGGKNIYGSHPVYLIKDKSGAFHVNYLRNTFPMDAIVKENGDSYALQFKVLGGVIDFHYFLGDENPDTALKQYHSYIGGFALPPFWSMGWHQSRWGYTSQEMVTDVFQKYKEHKLPMDVFWMDIDYMDEYISFTVDEKRYNNTEINELLIEHKKKLVVIVEPNMGLKKDPFGFTKEGEEKGLFVRNHKGGYLHNKVWPGKCYFVDYFHPETRDYWHKMLNVFQTTLNFSGVWLDMNEVAALTDGEAIFDESGNEVPHPDPCEDTANYPYLPGNTKLEKYTICPNAKHHNNVTHVNVHNYYPNQQARLTNEFLQEKVKNEFPFILSRANAPGMGKFAAHWTGDNQSTFKYLKTSIASIFNFNIFGIPMTGADVCGYGGVNPSEELCAKWMQLGTLYPFARQHSHISNSRKEPWQFDETMLTTSKKTLAFRYKILKYYYSLFIRSQNKGTIFKPVFFEFSNDKELLDNEKIYNQQFMIGSELLVIPNLEENKNVIEGYFPKATWYDLRNDEKFGTGFRNITAGLNEIAPVFLREGKTIFLQNVEKVENSFDLKDDLELLVALDEGNNVQASEGFVPALNDYNNKQHVENCISKDCNIKVHTTYDKEKNELKVKFFKPKFVENDSTPLKLNKIKVFGIEGVTQFNNYFTSKLKQNNKFFTEKIKAKTYNDHTIEFTFKDSVLIKEEIEIVIKFI
jgi:alpha-glucosidase (family GH31 glycosyl hydrolase)